MLHVAGLLHLAAVQRAMGKARLQIQRWMKRFDIDARMFRVVSTS